MALLAGPVSGGSPGEAAKSPETLQSRLADTLTVLGACQGLVAEIESKIEASPPIGQTEKKGSGLSGLTLDLRNAAVALRERLTAITLALG